MSYTIVIYEGGIDSPPLQEVNMSRLEEVLELRKQIQRQYLETAQEIWNSDLETCKKDSKARKEYELYRSKDRVLERIQAMEESIIEDLEYYNKKYKGGN